MELLAALIGALVGGAASLAGSLWAARKAYDYQLNLKQRQEEETVRGVVQALFEEITALRETYDREVGSEVEQLEEGQPFSVEIPLTQDYFTIYNANSVHIGQIPNPQLRRAIVRIYMAAMSAVDTVRYNNYLWQLYREAQNNYALNVTKGNQKRLSDAHKELIGYADSIKSLHRGLMTEFDNFNQVLAASGIFKEEKLIGP